MEPAAGVDEKQLKKLALMYSAIIAST